MDNTPFSKRVEILGDFYAAIQGNDDLLNSEFVTDNSETLWICLAHSVNYVTIQPNYQWAVDNTWKEFCEYLGLDYHGEYDSFKQMWEFDHE